MDKDKALQAKQRKTQHYVIDSSTPINRITTMS
jgi:hypothetical protein